MLRSNLRQLKQILIEPPPKIIGVVRHKSRLLSTLLLVMIFLFINVDIISLLSVPNYVVPWFGYVFLLSAYLLNRLSYYRIAASLVMIMFPVVVFMTILSSDSMATTADMLSYLLLELITASILLSQGEVIALAGINTLGILLLPYLAPRIFPDLDSIITPFAILTIGTALIVISMRHRDHVEKDRQLLLRQNEERYRMLFEEAPDGILIVNSDNRIHLANAVIYQLTGYSPEEVIGHSPNEFVAPEDIARRPPRPISEFQLPGQMRRERTLVCKDQSRLNVIISSSYMPDGYLQYIIQDISERKKMEDALRVSEEKFAKSFQSSPDAVTISSIATGKFIDVNDGFCIMSGYSRAEALGYSAEELHIWADPQHRKVMIDILQREGRVHDFETVLKNKSGEPINALLSVEVIEVGDQKCMVVITRDVTQRKKIEQEREDLIRKLEAKNTELEQFTYTVSHDLKAPLITIKGFLGFLAEDALKGNRERLEIDIQRINTAADKMHNLLNDLLELSRVGRMLNQSEAVSFADLLKDALELTDGRLQERSTQIVISPEMPVVYGDRQRLLEVVQNLLDNAAKFMGEQTEPEIEVGVRGFENDMPILYVRDNGVGIDPQYHERIFGLFNRLDQKVEGTGIGLALVKRIIELHGGRIWVESAEGQGATFYITLPLAEK